MTHPNPNDFNPDCFISPAQLTPWIVYFTTIQEVDPVYTLLHDYCIAKRAAMEDRLAGRIARALIFEDDCQVLYDQIPSNSPWKW